MKILITAALRFSITELIDGVDLIHHLAAMDVVIASSSAVPGKSTAVPFDEDGGKTP
jgi:hypothetical protein